MDNSKLHYSRSNSSLKVHRGSLRVFTAPGAISFCTSCRFLLRTVSPGKCGALRTRKFHPELSCIPSCLISEPLDSCLGSTDSKSSRSLISFSSSFLNHLASNYFWRNFSYDFHFFCSDPDCRSFSGLPSSSAMSRFGTKSFLFLRHPALCVIGFLYN